MCIFNLWFSLKTFTVSKGGGVTRSSVAHYSKKEWNVLSVVVRSHELRSQTGREWPGVISRNKGVTYSPLTPSVGGQ